VLTALRMELGRIDRLRPPTDSRIASAIVECRRLVDQLFRTVRDLALGLRPSMLDDLGLQPALEWLVRDVTRRYGVDVDLKVDGDLQGLPDRYRTCVYRAIQEALTNCVRHAHAHAVQVSVTGGAGQLSVRVTDDGIGFDTARPRDGLGLRGIEERVKELHGTMTIDSSLRRGTTIAIELPLEAADIEVPLARAAG
jgi:signal transduction histidine kinase